MSAHATALPNSTDSLAVRGAPISSASTGTGREGEVAGKTFLLVPFKEKDQVKSLGARWEPARKQWYVPSGLDLGPFRQWLTASREASATPCVSPETPKGIRLAALLSRVSRAVADALPNAEWVMAEIGALHERQENTYLDLVEHDSDGKEIAKTRGTIWKSVSGKVLAKFKEGTGADLAAGIKVMVKVQAQFHGQHGLSLNILDIDPSYTIGDMAARLRQIRKALAKEGIYAANRTLPMPQDFFRVAIVSPDQAAGLSDFRQEADLLAGHGVCRFDYFTAVFQGERAAAEILQAIHKALDSHKALPYNALVIIRGGGNVADLNWLNDGTLARQICLSPLPVLTGIGHSTDSTILDEVACRSFDTPSKVVAHIAQTVVSVVNAAQNHAGEILRIAEKQAAMSEQRIEGDWRETKANTMRRLERAAERIEHNHALVGQQSVALADAADGGTERVFENVSASAQAITLRTRSKIDALHQAIGQNTAAVMARAELVTADFINAAVTNAMHLLEPAAERIEHSFAWVRQRAVTLADTAVPEMERLFESLSASAQALVQQAGSDAESLHKTVRQNTSAVTERVDLAAADFINTIVLQSEAMTDRAVRDSSTLLDEVLRSAQRKADRAEELSRETIRQIVALGPMHTLKRGFAIVRSGQGVVITSAEQASVNQSLEIQFADGSIKAHREES